MRFKNHGDCKPLKAEGLFLAVETTWHDEKGLAQKRVQLMGSHDAENSAEFWRAYYALGGETLVDEDGDPVQ